MLTALETAVPAQVAIAIAKTNIEKVEDDARERAEIEQKLDYYRAQWRKCTTDEARALIAAEAMPLKERLMALPAYPTLIVRSKHIGQQGVMDDIALLLAWANEQLNMGYKLNDEQVETCAAMLYAEYGNQLRIEDVATALRKGLRGDVKHFVRFDMTVVFEWVKAHLAELERAREEYRLNKHLSMKEVRDGSQSKPGLETLRLSQLTKPNGI